MNMNFFWWWFMEIIIRPSIPHGRAVWIPSSNASIASLASWQYKVAKLILVTNMKIPKSALFLELGWEPIKQWLSRQTEGFLLKIKKLPITRLRKLVLMEVEYIWYFIWLDISRLFKIPFYWYWSWSFY